MEYIPSSYNALQLFIITNKFNLTFYLVLCKGSVLTCTNRLWSENIFYNLSLQKKKKRFLIILSNHFPTLSAVYLYTTGEVKTAKTAGKMTS